MVSLLGGAARTLSSEFEASLNGIERTLAERGQALISEFQTRAEALDTGTQKLNAALEARARQINETLVERAREIAHTFTEGKDTLVGDDRSGQDPDRRRHGRHRFVDLVDARSPRQRFRRAHGSGPPCRFARLRQPTSSASPTPASASRRPSKTTAASLSESRDRMAAAMQADLAKFAEGRAGIDARRDQPGAEACRRPQPDFARARRGSAQGQRVARRHRRFARQPSRTARRRPQQACPGPERRLQKLVQARTIIDEMVAGHVGKLAEGRNILSRALEADLGKLADSRASIDGLVAGQVEKIAEGRAVLAKALETDIIGIKGLIETIPRNSPRTGAELRRSLEDDLSGIRSLIEGHSRRLADDRSLLSQTLEADLAKLAESRSSIDGLVAGQVEKLAEGRDILKRALEADINTIKSAIVGSFRAGGGRAQPAFEGAGSRSAECEQPDRRSHEPACPGSLDAVDQVRRGRSAAM